MFNTKKKITAEEVLQYHDNAINALCGSLGVSEGPVGYRGQRTWNAESIPNIVAMNAAVERLAKQLYQYSIDNQKMRDKLNGKLGETIANIGQLDKKFKALETHLGLVYEVVDLHVEGYIQKGNSASTDTIVVAKKGPGRPKSAKKSK